MATTYTMRMDEAEKELIAEFAKAQGISMADFIRKSTLEAIEDAIDVHDAIKAYEEYLKNPDDIIPHEEFMQELGLA